MGGVGRLHHLGGFLLRSLGKIWTFTGRDTISCRTILLLLLAIAILFIRLAVDDDGIEAAPLLV
jgi:hypothetical protein